MFLNQHKTKSKDWTSYKKCGRVISLYSVKRSLENFVKPTHSGQTCIESRYHALYVWLSALKDSSIISGVYSPMFTVYYVSSQCVEAQMRKLDHMKQFAQYLTSIFLKPKGHFCLLAPPGKRQEGRPPLLTPPPPHTPPVLASLTRTMLEAVNCEIYFLKTWFECNTRHFVAKVRT